ncbi:hypothetical protein EYD10_05254 [Varanus komodoensis]|nr:hypothetical protein EYD10_05254 [Varanus komodoensis]
MGWSGWEPSPSAQTPECTHGGGAWCSVLVPLQSAWPGAIHTVLLLAEKEAAAHLEKLPGVQVELLSSLKALGRHVDGGQLTQALDGQFPYCHGAWVQFFQKLHRLVGDLTGASELLRSTTQELEQGEGLESMQAVGRRMERHRQLMQEVLCDTRLVRLQREGGALLARLRKEAARLSSSPDVRSSFASALSLYNLVEEEVHTLVTKSNQRLEHLEFLLKIRELEAEFSKLSSWFDERGELELRAAGAAEGGREGVERAYWRFQEFFKEATAHYSRGLSLSKEAARIQGSRFPEMEPFEAAKRAFQAQLTVFYMDMERKGAELETFLDLHRFCDQVTQFNLDCKRCLAVQSAGRKEAGSAEGRQAVERALQRLSGEFSPERFQQMKRQASSLRSQQGLAVWAVALESCQEAKRLLDGALASPTGAPGGGPRDGVGKSSALGPGPRPGPPAPGDGPGARMPAGRTAAGQPEGSQGHEGGSVRPPGGGTGRDGAGGEEAPLGATLECGVTEAPDTEREGSANPCPAPQSPPSPPVAHPHAERPPGGAAGLPFAKPPCRSAPGRGPRARKREAAQYFQLARHGSFSSEDTDSQNSTDDGQGAPLPAEPPGPEGGQDRALGILYLEKHSASSPAHAAPQ